MSKYKSWRKAVYNAAFLLSSKGPVKNSPDILAGIDIEKEARLIAQKKSELPAQTRKLILIRKSILDAQKKKGTGDVKKENAKS